MSNPVVDIDQKGFAFRVRALLPDGWFPDAPASGEAERAPVLNGILQGIGSIYEWAWNLLAQIYTQQRLSTASGGILEIYADDFFGGSLPRNDGESDESYRARIRTKIFPLVATRPAIEGAILTATGSSGTIIEPRNASDTKGIGELSTPSIGGGYGYGSPSLRYGSMLTPCQFFAILPTVGSGAPAQATLTEISNIKAAGVVAWVQNTEAQ